MPAFPVTRHGQHPMAMETHRLENPPPSSPGTMEMLPSDSRTGRPFTYSRIRRLANFLLVFLTASVAHSIRPEWTSLVTIFIISPTRRTIQAGEPPGSIVPMWIRRVGAG